MWLDLSNWGIVILNVISIPIIHLGISWAFTRMPRNWFRPDAFLFQSCSCEANGKIYQDAFRIRQWKGLLPDAAPWFDGFAKGELKNRDPQYLRTFIIETCRGELAHYAQVVGLWITLLWNPWPVAALAMVAYSVLSNLPCILLQRFTRARLRHLIAGIEDEGSESAL